MKQNILLHSVALSMTRISLYNCVPISKSNRKSFKMVARFPRRLSAGSRFLFLVGKLSRWGIHRDHEEELEYCSLERNRWRDNQAVKRKKEKHQQTKLMGFTETQNTQKEKNRRAKASTWLLHHFTKFRLFLDKTKISLTK